MVSQFQRGFPPWRKRGIAQPIMTDHAVFIGFAIAPFRAHPFLQTPFARAVPCSQKIHPTHSSGSNPPQADFGKFGVIFFGNRSHHSCFDKFIK